MEINRTDRGERERERRGENITTREGRSENAYKNWEECKQKQGGGACEKKRARLDEKEGEEKGRKVLRAWRRIVQSDEQ